MISRRTFFKWGLVAGGAFALDGFFFEPKALRVETPVVPIRGLSTEFDGFTICQITDVHHSVLVDIDYVDHVVKTSNSLNPDLTVLTGDYIDEDRRRIPAVIKSLSRLKARCGVVSILGNHDNFVDKEYTKECLAAYNIPLLENSRRIIEAGSSRLCIAGVKDYLEDEPDASGALKGVGDATPRLLLAHHPDYCEYLPRGERIDLVLSGHTHGGQVRLLFKIAPIVPSAFGQKYSGGLVRLESGTKVYVSRGIGVVGIPVRFNCPPELTLITLKPEAPGSLKNV